MQVFVPSSYLIDAVFCIIDTLESDFLLAFVSCCGLRYLQNESVTTLALFCMPRERPDASDWSKFVA